MLMVSLYVESLSFLAFPYIVLIAGTLPAVFAIVMSVFVASWFVKIHRFLNRKKNVSYYISNEFSFTEIRLPTFVVMTVIHSVAMTYLIVRIFTPFVAKDLLSDAVFLMITMWMCSWFAFALGFASWLLTRSGLMFENKTDGTRINLGVDMQNKLTQAIGYQAAATLIVLIISNLSNFSVLMTMAMAIAFIILPSSLFSIYIIKKKHSSAMLIRLVTRIAKII